MITKIGEEWIKDRLFSNRQPVLNKLVLGTGSTPPTPEDTKLENKQIEIIPRFDTKNQNKLVVMGEFNPLQLNKIKEIGLEADNILISRDLLDLKLDTLTTKIQIKYSINLKEEQ